MANTFNMTIVTYENPAALHMIEDWKEEQRLRIVSWEQDEGTYRCVLLPQEGYAPEIVYIVPCYKNVRNYDMDVVAFDNVRTKAMVESNDPIPFYKWLHFGKVPCRKDGYVSLLYDIPKWVHGRGKQ